MHRRRPGLLTIAAMAMLVVLAHGVPGSAESPSQQYVDDALRARLKADQIITIVSDPERGELPPSKAKPRKRRGKPTTYVVDYRKIALQEARRAHIRRPELFVRQMAAESGMQPCAKSGAGALGIAQIMPSTARSWKVDPWIPRLALRTAAQHMRRYEVHYGSYKVALAAYNAGPGAVSAAGGRVPAYSETREYVRRILDTSYRLPGMRQVYRLEPGLQSGFNRKLKRLQRAVHNRGGRLAVASGWRSYPEQMYLWKQAKWKYGGWQQASMWVAPPGCSNHNRGYAADLSGSLGLAHQLAPRFGLVFPMAHENWHIEPVHIPGER